jgi:hypothetical protein
MMRHFHDDERETKKEVLKDVGNKSIFFTELVLTTRLSEFDDSQPRSHIYSLTSMYSDNVDHFVWNAYF